MEMKKMEKLYLQKLKKINRHFENQEKIILEFLSNPVKPSKAINNLYFNIIEEKKENLNDLKNFELFLEKPKLINDVWIIMDGKERGFTEAARDYFKKRYPQFSYIEGDKLNDRRAKFLWYFKTLGGPRYYLNKAKLINKIMEEKRVEKVVVFFARNTLVEGIVKPGTIPGVNLYEFKDFAFQFAFPWRKFHEDKNKEVMEKFEKFIFE